MSKRKLKRGKRCVLGAARWQDPCRCYILLIESLILPFRRFRSRSSWLISKTKGYSWTVPSKRLPLSLSLSLSLSLLLLSSLLLFAFNFFFLKSVRLSQERKKKKREREEEEREKERRRRERKMAAEEKGLPRCRRFLSTTTST